MDGCRQYERKHISMIRNILIISLFFSSFLLLPAQNRAPSCWLHYQDNYRGDIVVNTLQVVAPSPTYTYYCALQWNAGTDGGGYCGMQEHPDGRNFIYSIWDPVSSNVAIRAVYTGEGTETENFGGEGTGLKSWNFTLGWETGAWYSFVSRTWDKNSHTRFGFWIYDHTRNRWHHLVTMDFPVADIRFSSSTGSFIEDWYGNGQERRQVYEKEAWKRSISNGAWQALTHATFTRVSPDDGAANYIDHYDGGVKDGHFFMVSGDDATPVTNTSGATLTLSNPAQSPPFAPGRLDTLTTEADGDTLRLTWQTDSAGSPFFAWSLKVYDKEDLSGTPLLTAGDTLPHARSAAIFLGTLPDDTAYYYRFYLHDIFDHTPDLRTGSFHYSAPAGHHIPGVRDLLVWPNPAETHLCIRLPGPAGDGYTLRLINLSGRTLQEEKLPPGATGVHTFGLESLSAGTYILQVTSGKTKILHRKVIIK